MKHLIAAAFICPFLLTACTPKSPSFSADASIDIVKALSADEMEGRFVGSSGGEKARIYIRSVLEDTKILQDITEAEFDLPANLQTPEAIHPGINIYGTIQGRTPGKGPMLIITAHYDHMGIHDGKIYNGADDNASGVAALFAIAESFQNQPPDHDIIITWLDGEEHGLIGAKYFLTSMQNFQGRPAVNMNLDMISQNQDNTIYMSGTYHTPALKSFIERAAKNTDLVLKFGHDRPEDGSDDWTLLSDHGPFHRAGFPFVYFGVEDHPHYHKSTDTFDTLPLDFYRKTLQLTVNTAHILDKNLDALAKPANP